MNDKKQALIDALSKVPIEVLQTAYLYAVNYTKYGVDVTITWQTATQNAYALEKAYKDGYYEGLQNKIVPRGENDQGNNIL